MIGLIQTSDLPPGFRFHPTDEELIMCYLRSQVTSKPCPVSIIPEVDIYKFDPWELPDKALFGENEWYFFTPRDRKYPNGVRPNRAAVSGYWKATGTDKAIHSGSKCVGVKKALVFYKGRPPKGIKTDWIMHEYRLNDQSRLLKPNYSQNGCMRLDDWVLCRIYKKKNLGRVPELQISSSTHQDSFIDSQTNYADGNLSEFPRACSSHNHLWEFECMGSFSQVRNANSSNVPFSNINDQETIIINNNNPPSFWSGMDHERRVDGVQLQQQSDAMKFQVNQTFLVNPNNELQ